MLVVAFAILALALHAAMLVAGNVLWGVPRDVWRRRGAPSEEPRSQRPPAVRWR